MLTENDYEGIGKLTITFNELEFMIEFNIMTFLDLHERQLGLLIAKRNKSFGSKLAFFKAIAVQLFAEYPDLKDEMAMLTKALHAVDQIAEKRNNLVHGFPFPHHKGFLLFSKKTGKAWDRAALDAVLNDMEATMRSLSKACYAVREHLRPLREASKAEWLANLPKTEQDRINRRDS